jgi:two-component system, cell cycle sensor histidine kinase and response regulator CckA
LSVSGVYPVWVAVCDQAATSGSCGLRARICAVVCGTRNSTSKPNPLGIDLSGKLLQALAQWWRASPLEDIRHLSTKLPASEELQGTMVAFYSKLFWKAFLSLLLAILILLPAFYWLTVPLINQLAYEVEETASRNLLDNVVQIVKQSQLDMDAWRQSALDAHKRDLKNILLLVESWTHQMDAEIAAGRITRDEARRQLLDWLRGFRYGNSDYVWVADYKSVLLVHPDQAFSQRDIADLRDAKGNLVLPPMVEQALTYGEGYHTYWWKRLQTGREAEKLSYFRLLPKWQLVIGTGVYIDDVEEELNRRRTAMIADLRRHLHEVRLARFGYPFIMDGQHTILIHPDPEVEGKNIGKVPDPGSGKFLGPAYVEAASRPDRAVFYHWNRPGDLTHYTHEKVAWIEYVPGYDWYVGATVYTEDLERSGHYLTSRILLAFAVTFVIALGFAFVFIRSLTSPILRLAQVARRHIAGDLTAVADIRRDDEIGLLADAFNSMVARLASQIEVLEDRVRERTQELAAWAGQLEHLVDERAAELRASEAKFRGLVEQSLAGIFVVQNGRFRYVNSGFARMHGYRDPSELIDQASAEELLVPEDRPIVLDAGRQLLSGELASDELNFTACRRDGTTIDVEASMRVFDYEGQPAIIGVTLDISERKGAERAREMALAAAEQLSRLKSEFMANMSHELRTPLHGIIGMANIGQRAADLSKAHDVCGRILASSQRLLDLLTALLDFSSLETGRISLEQGVVELRQVLEDVSASPARQAAAKGLSFQCLVGADLPQQYRGDGVRLSQILSILLSNAVKFTDQGGITISAFLQDQDLQFAVSDTGIGIGPEQLTGLFRPFEQVDGSSTRRHGGVGLGLALAQRLAALMGGSISVASELGRGATFQLLLPKDGSPEPVESAATLVAR